MKLPVVVRDATPSDCVVIAELIQDLSDYEKIPDGPKLNVDTLKADGFGEKPFYKCLLVSEQPPPDTIMTGALGYAVYFLTLTRAGKCVYMEDLYVSPLYRSKGVGTLLWNTLLKTGLSSGATLCRFCVLDWNSPSIGYYHSKGAKSATATAGLQMFNMSAPYLDSFVDNMKQPDGFIVRVARLEDLPAINQMQKELSDCMPAPQQMNITVDTLEAALSCTPPCCNLMVAATTAGELVGYTMYCFTYSTWQGRAVALEDFYIKEDYRLRNVGLYLLQNTIKDCMDQGCTRVDFVLPKDNAFLTAYSEKVHAVNMTATGGWIAMVLANKEMLQFVEKHSSDSDILHLEI